MNGLKGGFDMKRILLVEDDEHLQFLIKEELVESGYEVAIASDGVEAMSMLQAEGALYPDLIILDIRMPKMDGFETLGHLLKSKIDSPIIIHSAYSGYKNHPLTIAADAYIVKSHNFTQLKEAISELLGIRDLPLPNPDTRLAQAV
jgi:DNA-binding response OmpR family regulator